MAHGQLTMDSDKLDGRPRKGFHPTEAHRRKFFKNMAVLLVLVGLGALLYVVGVVKMTGG